MDPFGIHEPRLTNSRAYWLMLCSSSQVIQVDVLFTSRPSKLCASTLPNDLGSPLRPPCRGSSWAWGRLRNACMLLIGYLPTHEVWRLSPILDFTVLKRDNSSRNTLSRLRMGWHCLGILPMKGNNSNKSIKWETLMLKVNFLTLLPW